MKYYLRILLTVLALLACLFAAACSSDDDDDYSSPDDDDFGDDDDDDDAGDDDTGDDDAGDDDDDDYPDYPNDDRLRMNEIQALGTHNSYHVAGYPRVIPFLEYSHPPLDEQLELGVRQFELDLHYNHGNGLKVYHLPGVDFGTTCEHFVDCLTTLKEWSDEHPGHQPLTVLLEPKDDIDLDKMTGHDADVEDEILSVWPRERLITPDDVRGDYETLLEAITEDGWPTMGEVRDKAMFVCFDSGDFRAAYVDPDPSLAGRLLFVRADMDEPYAGFTNKDNPLEDADRINENAEAGSLVRTRADANCIEAYHGDFSRGEAAMETGAHFISTDFAVPYEETGYWFTIPDGTPSKCNPLTAPDWCTPEDVEILFE